MNTRIRQRIFLSHKSMESAKRHLNNQLIKDLKDVEIEEKKFREGYVYTRDLYIYSSPVLSEYIGDLDKDLSKFKVKETKSEEVIRHNLKVLVFDKETKDRLIELMSPLEDYINFIEVNRSYQGYVVEYFFDHYLRGLDLVNHMYKIDLILDIEYSIIDKTEKI